jgi:AcrR family transcriptional regulator
MSKPTHLRKRERRPAERPEEIAAAALSLFCEKGYNVTTIDEIAAAAGVTKGAVYHHFDSKEQLLQTAMTNFFDSALERAMENVAKSPARDAVSRVRAVLLAASELWVTAEFLAVFCLVFGEVGRAVPRLRETFLKRGPFRGWKALAEIIRDGQDSGAFRADIDSTVIARTIACGLVLQCMLLCSAGLNRTQVLRAFDESLETQLKLLSIRKPRPR